jgi:transposase
MTTPASRRMQSPTSSRKRRHHARRRKGLCLTDRPVLEVNAAGIDIGAREIYVAVPPDRDAEPVRVFTTFTEDLHRLADWLRACGITTVAMESTGVYWIPLYGILEAAGIRPCLVDARYLKNVPGRRTDWHECQWLQYLHSVGLLRAAFRPAREVCAVRTLMRHRSNLVEMASQHVLHMHKALTQMDLQIHHVISDLTGLTGLAILDAILAGERDPAVLARLRNPRIKVTEETIRQSLVGDWLPEQLFALQQSLAQYRFYQDQIAACDREIARMVTAFTPRVDPAERPLPPDQKRDRRRCTRRARTPSPTAAWDLRTELYKVFGVDVTQIPGVATIALSLFTELGREMTKWETAAHFASWLALCPDNDITGGRVVYTRVRKVNNRAAQLFRLAAHSLHHSQSPLGDYLRRMKAKLGPAAATTATAHKIAVIFYTMVKRQVEYDETIWAARNVLRQQREAVRLRQRAARLGYQLVPLTADPGAATAEA